MSPSRVVLPRARLLSSLFLAVAIAPAALCVSPAAAQEPTPTTVAETAPTSTTSTAAVPGDEAPTTTSLEDNTAVTQGDGVTGEGEVGEGNTTVVTNSDGEVVDAEILDPGHQEESLDSEPPDVDVTVPQETETEYGGQGGFEPSSVLVSSVAEARLKLAEAEDERVAAIAVVKTMRIRLKKLEHEKAALDEATNANIAELAKAHDRLRARALSAFVRGGNDTLGAAVDADGALDVEAQQTIVDVVFEGDQELIDAYIEQRGTLDASVLSLFDRMRFLSDAIANATEDVEIGAAKVEQAGRELEAFEAGSQIYVAGVVFPIVWPYDLPLIDSWGFPRMTGTSDQHWHEGIDLFAPNGTPLVATERGVVTRIGSGRLGGLRLWLRGESGTDWYYAHLSGFADDLTEGQLVEAGEVIGFVGATGNAVGTPPHLHMQVHPNGGEPVNPYPLLKVVSDRERAEAAAEALAE